MGQRTHQYDFPTALSGFKDARLQQAQKISFERAALFCLFVFVVRTAARAGSHTKETAFSSFNRDTSFSTSCLKVLSRSFTISYRGWTETAKRKQTNIWTAATRKADSQILETHQPPQNLPSHPTTQTRHNEQYQNVRFGHEKLNTSGQNMT